MRLILSEEDYELVDLFLKDEYDLIKESDPIFPILKNAVKIYYDKKGIKELRDLKIRHDKILRIKKSEQALVDKLDKELSDRVKSSLIKGGLKSTELFFCKLIPITVVSLVKSSDNKQIGKILSKFSNCVRKALKFWALRIIMPKKIDGLKI